MAIITQQEYAARRKTVLKQLGEGSIAFIAAGSELLRSGDGHYYYRQNSNFYYLTGFNEPDAILVLIPGSKNGEVILFNRPRDKEKEIWNGKRLGQSGACEELGVNLAYSIDEFFDRLPELMMNCERVYYPIGRDAVLDEMIMEGINTLRHKVRSGVAVPEEFHNIEPLLHELRLRKSPAEIATMQKAADASIKGHLRAMQACRPDIYEYELEAEFLYEIYKNGCRSAAYNAIVGGGANSCVLHYIENKDRLKAGELLLIDAGGEFENYASDITRTYPINGKFTTEQKQLYELVLKSQLAAISMIRPGLPYIELQKTIQRILTEGLIELGILQGDLETLLQQQAIRQFYMHNSGHWLGLDTHDAGVYKINNEWRPLEVGFVLTVEPGLYIPADSVNVDPKWWNIGIRIEDDIVVTEQGCEILTLALPKTVDEIEGIMGKE